MGVDHESVGGIGIKVDRDMIEKFISSGLFTEDEWNEKDHQELIERIEIDYDEAGSGGYTGKENIFYLTVKGKNLTEIMDNEEIFRDKLKKFGIILEQKDLIVISDLHMC